MGYPQSESPTAAKPERLVSLDAYRGFIMLVMASGGFGFVKMAEANPESPVWRFLAHQFDHVAWAGCSFWDLIQPSFMFMVGVALPYSLASRQAKGDSYRRILAHTVYRSVVLVALGVFLSSNWSQQTNYTFVNVLSQIGLGYTFVFLLASRGAWVQLLAAGAILAGYWLAFAIYPTPGPGFDYHAVFEPKKYAEDLASLYTGWFAHWNKNVNWAAEVDGWFLNLFLRPKPFVFNEGGYQTLNFVPSMATMIFGLMAGELLRSSQSPKEKFRKLVGAGTLCLLLGWLADATICPSVKRVWTPTWAVFSTGWTLWLLAGFYWVIDIRGYRRWAFPLVVVGMNSIAMYCMAQLMKGWVRQTWKTHLGPGIFAGPYGPVLESVAILSVLWLVCWWMYRRKVFLRI